MKYNVFNEYINIDNYSPFWLINEVSPKYRFDKFFMPIISVHGKEKPVHPDTFNDLGLEKSKIKREILVFPTSSFRTVYYPKKNVCYKVPLLRKITRGIRNLDNKSLKRSEKAMEILSLFTCKNFTFLKEICHYSDDPNFNYIEREMPKDEVFPLFYLIKSQDFNSQMMIVAIKNIIHSWMFFASHDIFLEYHTQNILIDNNSNIYYRDLSDVRSLNEEILRPSYASKLNGVGEMLSIIFDRTVCSQNLEHIFRYDTKLGNLARKEIKDFIFREIKYFGLEFPNYSMDFPKNSPERIPEKIPLVWWRNFA